MNTCTNLTYRIDNIVELSTICRGEWCRLLESEMDAVDSELYDCIKSEGVRERQSVDEFSRKIREGYKNLSPDIHV